MVQVPISRRCENTRRRGDLGRRGTTRAYLLFTAENQATDMFFWEWVVSFAMQVIALAPVLDYYAGSALLCDDNASVRCSPAHLAYPRRLPSEHLWLVL